MSLFKKKSLAEDLAQAEEKYNEAVEAIEAVEEAAVEEELSLDAELEKIESETDAEVAADTEAVVEKSARRKGLEFTYELVSVLMVAAVMTAILFTFLYRFSGVVGESMEPTLHSGDWVFLSQMEDTDPHYGDVVVISQENAYHENIIKRVIATEGQIIDINYDTGDVIVNGQILDEPYINNETINSYDMSLPLMVPEGHCFVMGDNRQNSIDSRSTAIGLIDNDYILVKCLTFRNRPSNGSRGTWRRPAARSKRACPSWTPSSNSSTPASRRAAATRNWMTSRPENRGSSSSISRMLPTRMPPVPGWTTSRAGVLSSCLWTARPAKV